MAVTGDTFVVDNTGSMTATRIESTGSLVADNINMAGFDVDNTGSLKAPVITTTGPITASDDLVVDTNTLFVDSTNNRVRIGTITPAVKLHVDGTTTATAAAFGYETVFFIRRGEFLVAVLNIVMTVICGIFAVWIGSKIGALGHS